jgi:hypothetical protein
VFEILLSKIAGELKLLKIDYMVIGGQAVLLYGEPRLTKDIDITLGIDSDQLSLILEFLQKLKLEVLVDSAEEFVNRTKVLPVADSASGIRVDFIFSSSEFEKSALKRTTAIKHGKTAIKYASLEDLIIHKIIAGRPRDIEDINSMLIKHSDFDRKYIQYWLGEFDKSLDTSYLNSFESLANRIK